MRIGEFFISPVNLFSYLCRIKSQKNISMNNLLIIGNGFDLAHNMKTSYNHFIEYLVEEQFKANKFESAFTLGVGIENIRELINEITNGNDFVDQNFKNKFIRDLIWEFSLKYWCDIENKYFELLNTTDNISCFFKDPKTLNSDFEIIKNYLVEYLKEQEKEVKALESYKKMFNLLDSIETRILNFNYTNTLQNLYSNEINESKIIHIHGELSNPINPIVFGYAANDEESRELIDKNDNEYMRYIKKHLYKRTDNEKLLTYYLEGTEGINVTIFGHSCGLSDKLILNQILNHKNIKSINIFYYEEYEHYFQTQVNIDRIMNKDEHFTKLVDFNNSHRMPQHNDTDEQVQDFIQYIEPIISKRKEARTKHKLFQSNNVVR